MSAGVRFGDQEAGASTLPSVVGRPSMVPPLAMSFLALPSSMIRHAAADRADGCRPSLRDVVVEYHAFVWRSLRRLGVAESDVADAAQRVFCVVAKNFDGIEPSKHRSYLFSVVMRTAANERRARKAMGGHVEIASAGPLTAPDRLPDEELDDRRARAVLDEILDKLGDDVRGVFVLHELEGLTASEIGELLAIPQGTVASRLRRAREQVELEAKRIRARMSFREVTR